MILIDYITNDLLDLLTIALSFFVVIFTGLTYNAVKAKPLVACKLGDAIKLNDLQILTVCNVGKAIAFDITIDIDPPIDTAKNKQGEFQTISKLKIPFLLPNEKEFQRVIRPKELTEKTYTVKATYYSKPKGIFKIFTRKTSENTIDFTDGGRLINIKTDLYHVVQQLEISAKKFKP